MSSIQVVSNTGPLISLEKLTNGYSFIRQLYDTVIVPATVLVEVSQGQFPTPQAYLQHYGITALVTPQIVTIVHPTLLTGVLHAGESEAIQLALQLNLPLLIEETAGRAVAQSLSIPISGIAGQVLKAYRFGLITKPDAVTMLTELWQGGRINKKIYNALIISL